MNELPYLIAKVMKKHSCYWQLFIFQINPLAKKVKIIKLSINDPLFCMNIFSFLIRYVKLHQIIQSNRIN